MLRLTVALKKTFPKNEIYPKIQVLSPPPKKGGPERQQFSKGKFFSRTCFRVKFLG
jgi:hypothetical protein